MVVYKTGQICPFDKTILSLSSHSGLAGSIFATSKNKAVKISAIPKGPAECPDPASTNILIISSLMEFAVSSSFLIFSSGRCIV